MIITPIMSITTKVEQSIPRDLLSYSGTDNTAV